jgi:hypothetical protein
MKEKRKAVTPKSVQTDVATQRAHWKNQLRAVNPDQRRGEPKWKREITKRLFEAVLWERGGRSSAAYRRGRNDGYFLGSLQRDHQAAEKLDQLPIKEGYLRQLKADIRDCRADAEKAKAALRAKARRDYSLGFTSGLKFAEHQLTHTAYPGTRPDESDPDFTKWRLVWLWNRMPEILTRCQGIPDLFQLLYGKPAKGDSSFPAFQKLCQRLAITLRPRGRPRKTGA